MRSMTGRTRAFLLIGVLLAGGARLGAQQAARKDVTMQERTTLGWPVLDRLTRLCDGRVYGADGSEILWEVFTSPAAVDDILAAYRARLRDLRAEQTRDGWSFRATSGERITGTLGIGPAPPPFLRDCPAAPADTRTFVTFSRMMRR